MTKQKISLFYGGLSKAYLKKTVLNAIKLSKKHFTNNSSYFLIENLETRLDTVLYRAKFSVSMRSACHLIKLGFVKVNSKIIKSNSYPLKRGDIIQILKQANRLVRLNVLKSRFWPLPPKHLVVNYKTLEVMLVNNLKLDNLATYFPFCLHINYLINFYRV